ncbi:MAG: hypothetical protein ACYTG5_07345 [Planctomycetota bacterium]|jgi:hypothetical protein
MGLVEIFLDGVLPPLVIAAPPLALAWKPWRRDAGKGGDWALILALAAAPIAASISLEGLPPLLPVKGTQWLWLCLVVAAVYGIVDDRRRMTHWYLGSLLLLILTPVLILQRLMSNSWEVSESIEHAGLASILLLVPVLYLPRILSQRPGPLAPIALTLIASTAGFVLFGGGSAVFGQLAGALAAALGLSAAVAFRNPAFALGRGALLVFSMALVGLLLCGHHFSELDRRVGLLVWAAPLSLVTFILPVFRKRPILALLPCLLILGLAGYLGAPVPDPYGY